ncbi:cytochrome P450 [Obba rivulosa]|uniref:Cytochrome P450 n=1 Tax=Obba rivulosa TaxID=1052685 RepID=A0A8E2DIM7_9APHY|nr:cytochrome P450 [Obba rivulosa]
MNILYLHSAEAAKDLLVKRGAVYSDRPPLVMTTEVCGYEPSPLISYGDKFRRQRSLMEQALGTSVIPTYYPLLEIGTCGLLHRLVTSPEEYDRHILRYAGALSLLVIYGHRVASNDDEMLNLADRTIDLLANDIVSAPPKGIWAVDVFPSLKHIPEWFPFASFKRKAAVWRTQLSDFYTLPFLEVKQKTADGTAVSSFCSMLLEEEKHLTAEKEYDIKWAANSIFTGSIDTTSSVIHHLLLFMILHPEKFAKAKEELDIVAKDRLPTFADRPLLPYVECILSEIFRLSCPLPLGLPHRLRKNDEYKGYIISEGSAVVANIMAMVRDETLFPDPEAFIPERYDPTVDEATRKARDPRQWIFGFGRRRCPGMHLAESSTWLAVVCILATLNVTKAIDSNGDAIEPEVKYENMVFRLPNKFTCKIQPRSEQHATLITGSVLE